MKLGHWIVFLGYGLLVLKYFFPIEEKMQDTVIIIGSMILQAIGWVGVVLEEKLDKIRRKR